jgi:hypothetical protein
MQIDDLGAADGITITTRRLPGSKFSVKSSTSTINTVILADQVLELRMRGGSLHCLRRLKVLDPIGQEPDWELGGEVADDI